MHGGGGRVLLDLLLAEAAPHVRRAFTDARYPLRAILGAERISAVAPTIPARLRALRACASEARVNEVLFAFNNLPPLARSAARTIVFVQSALFAGLHHGARYPWRVDLRHRFERALFAAGRAHADEIWVQTPTMAEAMRQRWPGSAIKVMPFADLPPGGTGTPAARPGPGRFFYPADGAGHKNHAALFAAFAMLAEAGVEATIEVTLPPERFAALADRGAPGVINLGPLPRTAVMARLAEADALIFPSLTESFGLPLLEAASTRVPIVAAERDYVRDVCVPAETFDPASSRSIADAVRRFLGASRPPVVPLSARQFVEALLA